MTEPTAAAAAKTETELIYVGRVELSGGKTGAAFLLDGKRLLFNQTKQNKTYRVGAVYALEVTRTEAGGTTVQFAPGHEAFVRIHDDKGEVAGWLLQDRAIDVTARRRKLHAQAGGLAEALEVLEPIRKAYAATDYTGQRAIELLVLEFLRRRAA